MGAMQNNPEKGSGKRGNRGSVNNDNRLAAFARKDSSVSADWGDCSPDKIQAVVAGITRLGGAVTFGLSRDFGAHSLTLMLDSKRQTLWYNPDVDLNEKLEEVATTLTALD